MPNKLDDLARSYEVMCRVRELATRKAGAFQVGPTSKGGIYLQISNHQTLQDVSIADLRALRDLLTEFLVNVVGDES